MSIKIDGKEYPVAHVFDTDRVLVLYEGLYVFADMAADGTWDLSGEPAREHEKPVLAKLVSPLLGKSEVKVTPPEE